MKTKVTPLPARFFEPTDLSNIPAIKWGRLHEKDAGAAFFNEEGKQHANPKMHACGLFFAKHTLIWVLPHTMFLHVHAVGPLAQSINAPIRQRI